MKPTEGTILTVVRESAQAGLNKIKETDDLVEIMHTIYEAGEEALKKTPASAEVRRRTAHLSTTSATIHEALTPTTTSNTAETTLMVRVCCDAT